MSDQPKIVFLDTSTIGKVKAIEMIKSLGSYNEFDLTQPSERIDRIGDSDIVITNKVIIDKEVMDACPNLKLICIAATGTNNVDLKYAEKKGIMVKNVAGYSTESVVQTTFAILFYLLNNLSYFDQYVKSGEYIKSPIFTHHGRSFWELKGKQFGIIGLGTIGKRVAEIATVFGAEVMYYSTSGKNIDNRYKRLELDVLLKTADVISIHCPLDERTKNLIEARELALMKRTAYLLNVGRGGIVNENHLANALNKSQIAGAGIDVLTAEPIKEDNPLLHVKDKEKIIITPHIAWISQEAREKLVEGIYKNIVEGLSGVRDILTKE